MRPSGRNAIAHGLSKPDAISVTRGGVRVWIAGARVCPGKEGTFPGTFGGALFHGASPAAVAPSVVHATAAAARKAREVRMRDRSGALGPRLHLRAVRSSRTGTIGRRRARD